MPSSRTLPSGLETPPHLHCFISCLQPAAGERQGSSCLPAASTALALKCLETLCRCLRCPRQPCRWLWSRRKGSSGGSGGSLGAAGAPPRQWGLCRRRKVGETFEHGDFLALQRCLVLAFRWEPGLWRPPVHGQTLCHGSLLLPFSHQGTRGNTGPLANLTGGRRHHMGTGSSGPPPPALTEPSEPYTHPVQDTAHPLGPPSAGSRPRVPPHPPTFTLPSTRRPLLPQPPGVSPRVCLALCPPQSTCCAEGAAGSLLLPPCQQSIFVHAPPAADTLLQPSAVLLGSSPGLFPPPEGRHIPGKLSWGRYTPASSHEVSWGATVGQGDLRSLPAPPATSGFEADPVRRKVSPCKQPRRFSCLRSN